jgi:uncharacterized membrane protein
LDQIATPSAAAPGNLAGGRGESERIVSIDVLRGLVMALMALDHTRDYFSAGGFNPRDLSEPALFLTRWITHFCAPTFVFLAGLSAFLYGSKRTTGELSRFLVTRGLWLILIDLTLIRFGWRFDFNLLQAVAGIIFVIGASMIALAALIWLPRWAIAGVALLMIGGHNLFDGVRAQQFGDAYWVWHLLHQRGMLRLGDGVSLYVLYPLIPWIGVMAGGYALGPAMQRTPEARQRLLFALGGAITLGFVLLRASNLYGDPAPWAVQHERACHRALLSQLREISAVPALSDDDLGAGADFARFVRACARRAGGRALGVRPGSVLLLCDAYLSGSRARAARRLRHERRGWRHGAARLRPARDHMWSGSWCWCCSIRSAAGSPD